MTTAAAPVRTGAVLADLLPAASTAARARLRDAALVAGGAALTGVAAQIAVPVPGSPVPVTGQTFAALLVGTALGTRRGLLSLALYLLLGAAGTPWFAEGGSGFGATFGYVVGFVLAAGIVGALAERGADRGPLRMFGTMALGSAAIYAVGVPWLALGLGLPLARAAAVGLVPFLLGDALKAALATVAMPAAWRLAGRR